MTFASFSLADLEMPPHLEALREEVREFLRKEREASILRDTPEHRARVAAFLERKRAR